MLKRILLALTLGASLGGAVLACNAPAGSSTPSTVLPSTPVDSGSPAASDAMSAEPSAS